MGLGGPLKFKFDIVTQCKIRCGWRCSSSGSARHTLCVGRLELDSESQSGVSLEQHLGKEQWI
jgi:hypothetical protein